MLCTQSGFAPELRKVNVRATKDAFWAGISTAVTLSSDPAPCGLARCRNEMTPTMRSTPAKAISRTFTGGRLRLAVPNSSAMWIVGPRWAGGVVLAVVPGVDGTGAGVGVWSGIAFTLSRFYSARFLLLA